MSEEQIKSIAKEYNADKDFLFLNTFSKFEYQNKLVDEYRKKLDGQKTKSEKDLLEYSRLVDSCNKTVGMLIKIIASLKKVTPSKVKVVNPLSKILDDSDE